MGNKSSQEWSVDQDPDDLLKIAAQLKPKQFETKIAIMVAAAANAHNQERFKLAGEIYCDLGDLQASIGDHSEAILSYEKSLQEYARCGMSEANNYLNSAERALELAESLSQRGTTQQPRKLLQGVQRNIISSLISLSKACQSLDDIELFLSHELLQFADSGLKTAETYDNNDTTITFLLRQIMHDKALFTPDGAKRIALLSHICRISIRPILLRFLDEVTQEQTFIIGAVLAGYLHSRYEQVSNTMPYNGFIPQSLHPSQVQSSNNDTTTDGSVTGAEISAKTSDDMSGTPVAASTDGESHGNSDSDDDSESSGETPSPYITQKPLDLSDLFTKAIEEVEGIHMYRNELKPVIEKIIMCAECGDEDALLDMLRQVMITPEYNKLKIGDYLTDAFLDWGDLLVVEKKPWDDALYDDIIQKYEKDATDSAQNGAAFM